MLLKNLRVYFPDFTFHTADVRFEGERITEVGAALSGEGEDCTGFTLLPGFLDVHSHGCMGCDWSRPNKEEYRKMTREYARTGVTSLLATTMSLPGETLVGIMETIHAFMQEEPTGAYLQGINMEGPFFSKAKKGAQAEENIIDPDNNLFGRLFAASGNSIRLCDVAPELPGALEFIRQNAPRTTISMAHTAATYEEAMAGIAAGVSHTTHLYNAMTPMTHRAPGVVGAVYDSNVFAELISDGIHVAPAMVRLTFRILGSNRMVLVSDSMEACGMKNGQYELGGQAVNVTDGLATLHDGTIAGSATNQFECCRRAISFGVPAEDAIKGATYNPAKSIGVLDQVGTIETGKIADLVITDSEYNVKRVFIRGKEFK